MLHSKSIVKGLTQTEGLMNAQELAGLILEERAAADESERLKCLEKCQNAHNACLADAGDDESKKSACNKALSACIAGCPAN